MPATSADDILRDPLGYRRRPGLRGLVVARAGSPLRRCGAWMSPASIAAVRRIAARKTRRCRFDAAGVPSPGESALAESPARSKLLSRRSAGRRFSDCSRFVVEPVVAEAPSGMFDPAGGRRGADSRRLACPARVNLPWPRAQARYAGHRPRLRALRRPPPAQRGPCLRLAPTSAPRCSLPSASTSPRANARPIIA